MVAEGAHVEVLEVVVLPSRHVATANVSGIVTLCSAASLWLDAQTDLAPKTRERYEGILSRPIRPRLG